MKTFSGPISQKVLVGALSSIATGALTWILTAYVWKTGIPTNLQGIVDSLGGTAGYFAGAYLAKHQVTPAELLAAIENVKQLHAAVAPQTVALQNTFEGGQKSWVDDLSVSDQGYFGPEVSATQPTPPDVAPPPFASEAETHDAPPEEVSLASSSVPPELFQ